MKTSTLALALAVFVAPYANATDPGNSRDYKSAIQDYVTLNVGFKHPEYGKLYFGFSEPGRVLVGEKRQKRIAVRCDWSADLKNGDHLLMIVRETFLIDAGFIYEVPASEKVDWIEGEPKIDKDQPNPSPDPTLASGTSPAGQEPRHR
jgi:hypothetical protein